MKKSNNISAVVCTFNEEKNIANCLESLKWADEIMVVDDASTDKTVEVVKRYTDKIFIHKSAGYVEPARNYAISKASNEWVLLLDADETVPASLSRKLIDISHLEKNAVGVSIPRKNIIFSKWIKNTGWWPDSQMRFFKKNSVRWSDKIHSQPKIKGVTMELEAKEDQSIVHNHYGAISEYLRKMNIYTTIEAQEIIDSKAKFAWIDLIRNPFNEFLSRFFARAGYRDGLHGLVLSLLQAVSVFVVSLKVWEHNGFEEVDGKVLFKETEKEAVKMRKEVLFWFTQENINSINNPIKKTAYKLFRKFVK